MLNNPLLLFKTRRFLPLFLTQFLGAFNDNLFRTALVTMVTYHALSIPDDVRPLLVTVAIGLFMLPFFLFSATAGQLADKFDKAWLVRLVKIAEIGIMVFGAVGFTTHSPYFLMVILFLMGAHSTFFGPIKYSILPDHLKEDELIGGNGLIEAGTFLAILIGTIWGGLLIGAEQANLSAVSVITITVAVIGYFTSRLIPKAVPPVPDLRVNPNFLKETWKVIGHAKENRSVFLSILGISWFWLVGATFLSQLPNFSKDILLVEQEVFTLLLTMFSLGIGLGSILCNKLLKGEISSKYVPIAAILMTLVIFDMSSASRHTIGTPEAMAGLGTFLSSFTGWHIMVDLFLIAALGGVYIVPLYAIMQSRSPASHRSRVVAANNILNALFMVVASVIATLLLSSGISIPGLFEIMAVANAFVALYICKLLPQTVIKSTFRRILRALYRVEVKGLEHYAEAGNRVLIIGNHVSFLDAILLAAFLPESVTFAVNTHIAKRWWMKPALSLIDAFPLDPTNPMATKSLIEKVKQDKKVVIFPEGRLTMTGSLMKVYEGPGLIASKAEATLLPIRFDGVQYTPFSRLRGKLPIRWFPKITMTVLPPQKLALPEEVKGRKLRHLAGQKLYDLMTGLMFESSAIDRTLFSSLLDAASIHGANHIIVEDIQRQPLNYQQFVFRSFLLGKAMEKDTQGEYAGVLLPNAVSTAVAFFALQAFGKIPAMLNFSAGASNILSACQTAQITTVFTSRMFIEKGQLSAIITTLEEAGVTVRYLEDYRQSLTLKDKVCAVLATVLPRWFYKRYSGNPAADSPAVVLFTSGSEGKPKGVVLSHKNIQANRYQLSAKVDFTGQDIVFNALPMFHSFGLTAATLLPLLFGIRVFFYPSPLHYRIVPELIYDTNATIMFGTDTFLSGYAKYAHPYDLYSMRYVFAGAERLKEKTRAVWSEKFGVRIFEGYGATETSPVLSINTPMQHKHGTVGRLLPGISYKIEPVPGIDEGGRLFVQGPNVMVGYVLADNPGVLVPPHEGWYDTGDIVAMDEDGFIAIKGRAKRFAKIGGEMVSLTAVETYVSALWPQHLHAVVSIQDAKKGEQLVLVTTNAEAAREAIVIYTKSQQIPELSIPRKIITTTSMPLLGTGKVDYVSVQALVAGNG